MKSLWSTRRRRYLLAIGAVMMLIMPVASVELTSQSWFCNSCHIMNTYYSSWKVGTHKEVECVRCHIPPGVNNFVMAKLNGAGQVVDDILERTSTKPSASVSDFSCTRSGCHDVEKIRKTTYRGKYFFDHGKHLHMEYLGIDLHCTTCHSHVSGEKHFELNTNVCVTCHLITPGASVAPVPVVAATDGNAAATAMPVMHTEHVPGAVARTQPVSQPSVGATQPMANPEELWSVIAAAEPKHRTAPRQCKNCHEAPKKPVEYRGLKIVHDDYLAYGAACESCHKGVTARPAAIDEGQCFSCHDFGIEKMTSVVDMHRVHTNGRHKVECFSCHGVIRHGPVAQSIQLAQIDCQSCHQEQHAIQRKTYVSNPAATAPAHLAADSTAVSPMFLVHVSCTGCHTQKRSVSSKPESGATVAVASAKSCDNCHQPGLGEKMVPLWQKSTRDLYAAARKMLPQNTLGMSEQQQRLVKEAEGLLELVRLDGSWGAHNPKYTQKLLEDAQQKIAEATPASLPQAKK